MEQSHIRLTEEEKLFVIFHHEEGMSYNEIIDLFESRFKRIITKGTISKVLSKYYERGCVENLSSPGRPQIYPERDKRALARTALLNQDKSYRDIESDRILNPEGASDDTIRRSAIQQGIITMIRPKRLNEMTDKDIELRKQFAREHLEWTFDDWKLGLFADEADLFPTHSGKQYMRLKENQCMSDLNISKGWEQKKLTIKVWGIVSFWGVGPLVRIYDTMKGDKYLKTLETNLEPILPDLKRRAVAIVGHKAKLILIDDNAKYHRVVDVKNWKEKMGFSSIVWPSYSPDINIIENIWSLVQDKQNDLLDILETPDDTWKYAQEIWHNLESSYICNLYKSLPDRIKDLYKNKGGPIHY